MFLNLFLSLYIDIKSSCKITLKYAIRYYHTCTTGNSVFVLTDFAIESYPCLASFNLHLVAFDCTMNCTKEMIHRKGFGTNFLSFACTENDHTVLMLMASKLLREINVLVICSLHSKKSIKKIILFPIVLKSFNFTFKYLLLFHSIILLANVFNNF